MAVLEYIELIENIMLLSITIRWWIDTEAPFEKNANINLFPYHTFAE